MQAEGDSRRMILLEEEMALQKRVNMEEDARRTRYQHVKELESRMKQSLDMQQRMRDRDRQKVENELSSRAKQHKITLKSRIQEEDFTRTELTAQARLQDLVLSRNREQHSRSMQMEWENKML